MALSNKRGDETIRKLELDAFYPPSDEKLSEYRKLTREHLEHLVALEAAKNLSHRDFILIDGSISGRMTHVSGSRYIRQRRFHANLRGNLLQPPRHM